MKASSVHWEELADKTCAIIATCIKNRSQFESAATERQTTFESLMAAAIIQMIRQEIDPALVRAEPERVSRKRGTFWSRKRGTF